MAGEPAVEPAQRPVADMQVVSSEYFRTLELPILAGRAFDERDRADGAPVCIVNEAFAARHLQGRAAVGRTVQTWQAEDSTEQPRVCEIVGVAANARSRADALEHPVQIYYPLSRITPDDIFLVVRPASGDAEALASQVRAAISRVDTEQLVSVTNIATLEGVAREATARYRFRALLIAAFAAQPEAVIGLIARGAARVLIPGVVVGVALALVMGQLLGAMLFGVRAFDAATFTPVLVVLAVTAAASVAGPALRATRIDPVGALRSD